MSESPEYKSSKKPLFPVVPGDIHFKNVEKVDLDDEDQYNTYLDFPPVDIYEKMASIREKKKEKSEKKRVRTEPRKVKATSDEVIRTIQTIQDKPSNEEQIIPNVESNGNASNLESPETQRISSEDIKVQSNSNENTDQSNSNVNTDQSNSNVNKVQSNSHEDKVQSNSHQDKVQSNSNENEVQSNSNENTDQSNSNVNKVQSNSHEDKVQSNSNDNEVQISSNNSVKITNDCPTSENTLPADAVMTDVEKVSVEIEQSEIEPTISVVVQVEEKRINYLEKIEEMLKTFKVEDKPWLQSGVQISDHFNFGLNEATWLKYCERRREISMSINAKHIKAINNHSDEIDNKPSPAGSMPNENLQEETNQRPIISTTQKADDKPCDSNNNNNVTSNETPANTETEQFNEPSQQQPSNHLPVNSVTDDHREVQKIKKPDPVERSKIDETMINFDDSKVVTSTPKPKKSHREKSHKYNDDYEDDRYEIDPRSINKYEDRTSRNSHKHEKSDYYDRSSKNNNNNRHDDRRTDGREEEKYRNNGDLRHKLPSRNDERIMYYEPRGEYRREATKRSGERLESMQQNYKQQRRY